MPAPLAPQPRPSRRAAARALAFAIVNRGSPAARGWRFADPPDPVEFAIHMLGLDGADTVEVGRDADGRVVYAAVNGVEVAPTELRRLAAERIVGAERQGHPYVAPWRAQRALASVVRPTILRRRLARPDRTPRRAPRARRVRRAPRVARAGPDDGPAPPPPPGDEPLGAS